MPEGDPTLAEIILSQLKDLDKKVEELREGFVSEKSWEQWRRENYGTRIKKIEDDIRELQNRFRSNVMSAVTNVVYPLVVAAVLYIATRGGHH